MAEVQMAAGPDKRASGPPARAAAGLGRLLRAVYSKRIRTRRIAEGGETIGSTLRPEAGSALRAIMEAGVYPSKLAAIEAALIREQDRLRWRRARANSGEAPWWDAGRVGRCGWGAGLGRDPGRLASDSGPVTEEKMMPLLCYRFVIVMITPS